MLQEECCCISSIITNTLDMGTNGAAGNVSGIILIPTCTALVKQSKCFVIFF